MKNKFPYHEKKIGIKNYPEAMISESQTAARRKCRVDKKGKEEQKEKEEVGGTGSQNCKTFE